MSLIYSVPTLGPQRKKLTPSPPYSLGLIIYNLNENIIKYLGRIENVFHTKDIDAALKPVALKIKDRQSHGS
jgi:hypothetical protein